MFYTVYTITLHMETWHDALYTLMAFDFDLAFVVSHYAFLI